MKKLKKRINQKKIINRKKIKKDHRVQALVQVQVVLVNNKRRKRIEEKIEYNLYN
jgi:hypothetical protein